MADVERVENFVVDEWKKWCRLCATAESQYINIITGVYEPESALSAFTNSVNRKIGIAEIIEEFLRVHIEEDDKLSQFICADCFQAINTMLEFKDRVYKVQKMYIELQSDEFRCTQINRKMLYEKHDLIETDSCLSPSMNNITKLPVEEIFMPDLSFGSLFTDNLRVEVKSETKIAELPSAEVIINELENEYDPISDEKQDSDPNPDYGEPIFEEHFIEEHEPTKKKAKRKSTRQRSIDETKKDGALKTKKDTSAECQEQQQTDSDWEYDDATDGANKKAKRHKKRQVNKKIDEIQNNAASKTKKNKSPECQDQQVDPAEYKHNCTKCEQKFILMKHYVGHMKKEHHEIACPQCPEVVKTGMELRHHMKEAHREKKLNTRESLDKHNKSTNDVKQKRNVCELCGLTFKHRFQLSEHILQHTECMPFECKECGMRFKNKINLSHHRGVHGDKHICTICGKQLNTRRTLNSHLLVHSDKMEHKCDFCGRLFKRPNTLKNHLIAHTNLRPYACNFCDKRFSTGSGCRFHKKTMHPKELAELEATGAKAFTKNVPPLHLLKEVSKIGECFKPLASKQTGDVKFDQDILHQLNAKNIENV